MRPVTTVLCSNDEMQLTTIGLRWPCDCETRGTGSPAHLPACVWAACSNHRRALEEQPERPPAIGFEDPEPIIVPRERATGLLDHSTPTVTLSIYSHVVEGNESAAMDVLGDRLEQMRNRIADALENADGYRMATVADSAKKKARRSGLPMVAGTGFEPVTFGL